MKNFTYDFKSGPITLKKLQQAVKKGNCRLAIQYYFYKIHNLYLEPKKILCPYSYKKIGKFIITEKDNFDKNLRKLKKSDIIYAEKIRSKNGKNISKEKKNFKKKNDWIVSLHTAIYLGDNKIWHANSITRKTNTWTFKKFIYYYNPVAAKRIILQ